MFKGNMADILRQAQELGENLKEKQAELAQKTVQVSVGGDMVSMTFNGRSEALSIRIDPEIVDRNDIRMLEDLVLSAVNEGVRRSQEMMQEEMSKLAGGLKIPGITA
ncbi:MAG: YbaB/EbfC family nucleoid-associated protein [SAR324 cluster bacterium]|nr:YbaB/EbfC family nucleoid-associated protein [SAR324 cluster bacterium]